MLRKILVISIVVIFIQILFLKSSFSFLPPDEAPALLPPISGRTENWNVSATSSENTGTLKVENPTLQLNSSTGAPILEIGFASVEGTVSASSPPSLAVSGAEATLGRNLLTVSFGELSDDERESGGWGVRGIAAESGPLEISFIDNGNYSVDLSNLKIAGNLYEGASGITGNFPLGPLSVGVSPGNGLEEVSGSLHGNRVDGSFAFGSCAEEESISGTIDVYNNEEGILRSLNLNSAASMTENGLEMNFGASGAGTGRVLFDQILSAGISIDTNGDYTVGMEVSEEMDEFTSNIAASLARRFGFADSEGDPKSGNADEMSTDGFELFVNGNRLNVDKIGVALKLIGGKLATEYISDSSGSKFDLTVAIGNGENEKGNPKSFISFGLEFEEDTSSTSEEEKEDGSESGGSENISDSEPENTSPEEDIDGTSSSEISAENGSEEPTRAVYMVLNNERININSSLDLTDDTAGVTVTTPGGVTCNLSGINLDSGLSLTEDTTISFGAAWDLLGIDNIDGEGTLTFTQSGVGLNISGNFFGGNLTESIGWDPDEGLDVGLEHPEYGELGVGGLFNGDGDITVNYQRWVNGVSAMFQVSNKGGFEISVGTSDNKGGTVEN